MKPNFSNKDLQDIHVNSEKSIASHLSKLDEVSNDIKILETVLSKSGISINFRYVFEEESQNRRLGLNEFERINVRVEIQHCMVWDRDKQRIIYEVHETENEIVDPPADSYRRWGPSICLSKPLIESKAHIRLKIQPELQHFYSAIIKLLGQGQVQENVVEHSPNLYVVPF